MAHHERRSFRGAQLFQRLFHLFPQLDVARETIRRWPLVGNQVQRILLLLFRQGAWRLASRLLGAFLAHAVDRVIRGDAISPGTEIRARTELPEVAVSP